VTRKLICGACGEPVVFRREEAQEQRVLFDVEDQPMLDDDPVQSEAVEGLFCPNCLKWYADDVEDVLGEIPNLLASGALRLVDVPVLDQTE
jgi:uncharacterized protein YbaR (Trm112 family)